MKVHVVAKVGVWLGVFLWAHASCNGSGSDSDEGAPGADAGSGPGAGGSGLAGNLGFAGSNAAGGTSAQGGAGASGVGGSGIGQAGGFVPGECGTTECTDCIDNDGDGKSDGFDPDCTGGADDDESSFATGIPGDNQDACKQDCFFDGNSGQGGEKCLWDLACDPLDPGANSGCPYDETKLDNCPPPASQECIDSCIGLVPNGCDCFGCCTVTLPQGGTRDVVIGGGCSYAQINDATACPSCTQRAECLNPCERCEYCVGKNEIPADCAGSGGAGGAGGEPLPSCPAGVEACTPSKPCTGFAYCLTGCCVPQPH